MEGEAKAPGFRFHPTDEELVSYYLTHKIYKSNFTARAIEVVDLNKCEPWDLAGLTRMISVAGAFAPADAVGDRAIGWLQAPAASGVVRPKEPAQSPPPQGGGRRWTLR